MIVVRIMLKVKPESQTHFARAIRENIRESRKFEGCQHFDLFSHNHEEHSYLLYQEWESQASFDAFRKSDYFEQSGREIIQLLEAKPEAAYYHSQRL
jgi:quinol monooxygenase YgiN